MVFVFFLQAITYILVYSNILWYTLFYNNITIVFNLEFEINEMVNQDLTQQNSILYPKNNYFL